MKKPFVRIQSIIFCSVLFLMLVAAVSPGCAEESKDVILSTTTSTVDSGLLDDLIPVFEKKTGYLSLIHI